MDSRPPSSLGHLGGPPASGLPGELIPKAPLLSIGPESPVIGHGDLYFNIFRKELYSYFNWTAIGHVKPFKLILED